MPRKREIDKSVWDAALDRIRQIWDMADDLVVSFSGGKDSTVLLNATRAIHKERGETKPLKVLFYDEEAIPMPTIDYVYREACKDDIEMHWFCLPVRHTNACSPDQPYWHCWDKKDEELWCRPMPDNTTYPKAIIWHEGNITEPFKRNPVPDQMDFSTKQMGCFGSVSMLIGLRASESLRRYQVVTGKSAEALNYVSVDPLCKRIYKVKPIYDFTTEDVWTAHDTFGWDHNTSYDDQERAGISRHNQRVCPPFGSEPLGGLHKYQTCYPELAEKMLYRVAGVATAMRYARTGLYAFGGSNFDPTQDPEDQIEAALLKWNPEQQKIIRHRIKTEIIRHKRKGGGEVPMKTSQLTGLSWPFLYMIAVRGDFKNRKTPLSRLRTYDSEA